MSSRLQKITLDDFTGGLNLRSNPFHLEKNESPDMLNMEVDPKGGFYSRKGWRRWFDAANIDDDLPATVWDPRSAEAHVHLDDSLSVYVTNEAKIWHSHPSGTFNELFVAAPGDFPVTASPHLADFASWGDDSYIAAGRDSQAAVHESHATLRMLTAPSGTDPGESTAGPGGWNNDYVNPVGGHAPQAEHVEPHAGYLFYANLNEDTGSGDTDHKTRIRWSHPGGHQEDFAFGDFIDIDAGGGQITALLSFQDHLLIFKRDSLWGLYGYDNNSWQLIKISRAIGAPSPTAITRSETAAFFFSSSGRNTIYGYTDGQPVDISDKILPVMEEIVHTDNVWLAWADNRLWANLPWLSVSASIVNPEGPGGGGAAAKAIGSPSDSKTTTFIFETDIGNGVWTMHRMSDASLGPIVEGADIINDRPLAIVYQSPEGTDERCAMALDNHAGAFDIIDEIGTHRNFVGTYTSHWMNAGWPELLKSWRRPRFVVTDVSESVTIAIDSFVDYGGDIDRRHTLNIDPGGISYWREGGYTPPGTDGGFDWLDETWVDAPSDAALPEGGARWQSERSGSLIVRTVADAPQGGGFGKHRALKLRFSSNSGDRWGFDAAEIKYLSRRFTT